MSNSSEGLGFLPRIRTEFHHFTFDDVGTQCWTDVKAGSVSLEISRFVTVRNESVMYKCLIGCSSSICE